MRDEADPVKPPHPLASLVEEPWRHDFFYALRLLETHFSGKPRLGTARKPADEMVRLGQTPDLAFPPATLSAIELQDDAPARVEVRFFGLFGPHGPLPTHMTEYALERKRHHGDPTLIRFADVFHHRLLLLFYRAWAQAQPVVHLDRPHDDQFTGKVASLLGLGTANHKNRDAAPDYARLFFSGYLSHHAKNADGLRAILGGYLRMPIRVESFTGQWLELDARERTRIGRQFAAKGLAHSSLGAGAVLGSRVFDRQHNFRIHAGPLTLADFESLLPVGSALPAVEALLRHYVGIELSWDLELHLKPEEWPVARLGRYGRLGWTTWVGNADGAGRMRSHAGLPAPSLKLRPTIPSTAYRNRAPATTH